jgi:mono/diheme cytochrome c family protein
MKPTLMGHHHTRKQALALLGMVLTLVAGASALLRAQARASVWDGVYSADQAKQGEALYHQNCASCHGDMLEGKDQAPPLTGPDFAMNWNGATLGDLFDKIQLSMPADKPGQLTRDQNAAILAFILNGNQFPAGDQPLPTDADRLQQIRFEAVKPKP